MKTKPYLVNFISLSSLIVALCGWSAGAAAATTPQLTMNRTYAGLSLAEDYNYQLLHRVLTVTADEFSEVELVRHPLVMTQSRIIHELKSGRELQVAVLASGYWDTPGIKYVPVPVRRGLLGWRVLVANKNSYEKVSQVIEKPEVLGTLTTGFGEDWIELELMRRKFAYVDTAPTSSELYAMLRQGQVETLSRSVMEVWDEADRLQIDGKELRILPKVVIRYPLADMFFLRSDQEHLAERILRGLELLRLSGEFDQLFAEFNARVIRKSELENRDVILFDEPDFMPPGVAEHWWFDPRSAASPH